MTIRAILLHRWAVILILLLSITSIQCGKKKKDMAGKEKPPVAADILIASQQLINSALEVNGTVLANESAELHPEISGRITYLNMPDGAHVQEGTLLVRINDAELQAQLEQQSSQLALARKTEQRLQELLKINGVSQAEYDAALNQVTSLEAAVKVTKAMLDKTQVHAPFTGRLGLREVSPGAYVTPQTVLGSIQQSDRVKIDFSVPESRVSLVAVGRKVRLLNNDSEEGYSATIAAVEPQINASTRNIRARAVLNGSALLPGSFVKVYLEEQRKGIMVPTNAIIPDALASQLVVLEKGKAAFRPVETGYRDAGKVEITKGIQPGDSIVVSGMLYVRPGGDVKVKKVMDGVK